MHCYNGLFCAWIILWECRDVWIAGWGSLAVKTERFVTLALLNENKASTKTLHSVRKKILTRSSGKGYTSIAQAKEQYEGEAEGGENASQPTASLRGNKLCARIPYVAKEEERHSGKAWEGQVEISGPFPRIDWGKAARRTCVVPSFIV